MGVVTVVVVVAVAERGRPRLRALRFLWIGTEWVGGGGAEGKLLEFAKVAVATLSRLIAAALRKEVGRGRVQPT